MSKQHRFDLSVVIVNYNVVNFLEQCLNSVLAASQHLQIEVFVVDNNSVDGSVTLVREKFPTVKLIANTENVDCICNAIARNIRNLRIPPRLEPPMIAYTTQLQKPPKKT